MNEFVDKICNNICFPGGGQALPQTPSQERCAPSRGIGTNEVHFCAKRSWEGPGEGLPSTGKSVSRKKKVGDFLFRSVIMLALHQPIYSSGM